MSSARRDYPFPVRVCAGDSVNVGVAVVADRVVSVEPVECFFELFQGGVSEVAMTPWYTGDPDRAG